MKGNVASFDQTEANLDKTPQSFENFIYDNASGGGILASFDEVNQLIQTIKGDIDDLHSKYNQLMNMYDTFTDYNDTMNGIIKTMSGNVASIENNFKNIVSTAQQTVQEHMDVDKTLMADLGELNNMLKSAGAN